MSLRAKPRSSTITHDIHFPPLRLLDIDAETIPSDTGDDNRLTEVSHYHKPSNLSARKQQIHSKTPQNQKKEVGVPIPPSARDPSAPTRHILSPDDTSLSETETIAPPTGSAHTSRRYHHELRSNVSSANRISGLSKTPADNNRFSGARLGVMQSRGRPETGEDDAWNRIRVQQLEAEADRLRQGKLLESCWQVWTKSHQWIVVCTLSLEEVRTNYLT